jgi:hypothetical protein
MTAPAPGAIPPSTARRRRPARPARKPGSLARNDVEAYDGRESKPRDNGYLTGNHAEYAAAEREGLVSPLKPPSTPSAAAR